MGNLAGRKLRKEYDKDIQKASRGRYRPELMGVFRYSTSKLSNIPQHEGWGGVYHEAVLAHDMKNLQNDFIREAGQEPQKQ